MIFRIIFLVIALLQLAPAQCKVGKFHVLETDVAIQKDAKKHSLDELRKYTRETLKQKEQERLDLGEQDQFEEGSGGTVITNSTTMVVYLQNPSESNEEMVIRDFLPQDAMMQDWHVHSEGTTFTPTQYDTLSEAQAAFYRATEEGRTAVMMGDVHSSSTGLNMKWIDPTNTEAMPKIEVQEASQISGMVLKVSPLTIFSISLTFAEEVSASADVSTVKDLYKTHLSIEAGPKATALIGMVESPNYPLAYPNNADVKVLIHMAVGNDYGIKFTLNEIDTEACCDRIIVYDGVTTSAQVIGMFSGSETDNPTTTVTTKSSDLLVQFQSDCYKSSGLYSYTFQSLVTEPTPTCEPTTNITGQTGTLTSPGYPINYPANSDCDWVITTAVGQWTTLLLNEMDITDRDVVTVFYFLDSNSQQDVILATYSGSVTNDTNGLMVAESNSLTIRLIAGIHEIERNGFSFNWDTMKPPSACDGGIAITDETEGFVESDNYPSPYFSDSLCRWQIEVDSSSVISLNIKDFSTELEFDWLYIYDGPNETYPLLAEVSGTNGQDRLYITSQEFAFIVFISDDTNNDRGFYIDWQSYVIYQDCEAGTILNEAPFVKAQRGLVTTPNFPEPFPGFTDCEHIIETDINTAVNIDIRKLDLGINTTNRIVIYDGPTNDPGESRVLFDSNFLLIPEGNFVLNSTQNQVFVDFTSDQDNDEFTGFAAYFHQIPLDDMCPYNTVNELGEIPQGKLTSPLYPGYYPKSISACAWDIRTDFGTFVSIRTIFFHVGEFDEMVFYNGGFFNGEVITVCRGLSCPYGFRAQNNSMYITFESSDSHPGFEFDYFSSPNNCRSSTETLTGAEGYITSTNYPLNYNPNEECEWAIVAGRDDYIEFQLRVVEIQPDYDYLLITDEINGDVHNFSGKYPPRTFTTSRRANVYFHSDDSGQEQGFELYYTAMLNKVPLTNQTLVCEGYDTILTESGRIYSHQFLTGYPNNLDYCWTFVNQGLQNNTNFRFDFSFFDTEALYDVVNIYTGASTDNSAMVDTYSGVLGSFTSTVTAHSVTILFHTDGSISQTGFELNYSQFSRSP